MEKGRFIVFEGGEGAGKDTQIDLLREELTRRGVVDRYLFVRDPGSTEVGTKLREIVLHNTSIAREAELLIFLVARVQLVEEKVRPALEVGMTVISNRFDLSTIAYQIYGRERQDLLPFVKQMSEFALKGIRPDVIIFLDCPLEVGLRRTAEARNLDRFESEKLAFHERVRAGYHAHIGEYPEHHIIDGARSKQEVHADVLRALQL